MEKTISIRGKKDIICVYNKYPAISGQQDTGRPQATVDFIRHLASLPKNEDTKRRLKASSVAANQMDVSSIADNAVPVNIKINIEIEEDIWEKAMDVFRFAFDLAADRSPQMPFLLKVSGMEYIRYAEEKNAHLNDKIKVITLDDFTKLSTDEKLSEIYKLLLERS